MPFFRSHPNREDSWWCKSRIFVVLLSQALYYRAERTLVPDFSIPHSCWQHKIWPSPDSQAQQTTNEIDNSVFSQICIFKAIFNVYSFSFFHFLVKLLMIDVNDYQVGLQNHSPTARHSHSGSTLFSFSAPTLVEAQQSKTRPVSWKCCCQNTAKPLRIITIVRNFLTWPGSLTVTGLTNITCRIWIYTTKSAENP